METFIIGFSVRHQLPPLVLETIKKYSIIDFRCNGVNCHHQCFVFYKFYPEIGFNHCRICKTIGWYCSVVCSCICVECDKLERQQLANHPNYVWSVVNHEWCYVDEVVWSDAHGWLRIEDVVDDDDDNDDNKAVNYGNLDDDE